MEQAAADRLYDRLHSDLPFHDGRESSWAAEASAEHPYHFRDGVTIFVSSRDLNPEDKFLSR